MADKRESFTVRIDPELFKLGNIIIEHLNLVKNDVICQCFETWIIEQMSAIIQKPYSGDVNELESAIDDFLKFKETRVEQEIKTIEDIRNYKTSVVKIKTDRQNEEIEKIQQTQNIIRDLQEHVKSSDEDVSKYFIETSTILNQVLDKSSVMEIGSAWKERVATSKKDDLGEHITNKILECVNGNDDAYYLLLEQEAKGKNRFRIKYPLSDVLISVNYGKTAPV